jgi:LmbE family N-acetylglucosaminyl deacetylase
MTLLFWLSTCGSGVVLLARVAWWLRTRRFRAVFRLPARRDDWLVCRGDQQTFAVPAERDGFELPAGIVLRGQTAFLTLDVKATPMGRLVDPFVEVSLGAVRYRQYFERHGAGRRHLNLSPLLADGGPTAIGRVGLRGGSIRWKRDASLVLFDRPPIDEDTETLVLAPHPDDAEIAAFGLYRGHRSWVATITAGERGTADLSAVVSRPEHMNRWNALLRVWDSVTIPQLGEVPAERCLNLVYPDAQLKEMYEQSAQPVRIACDDSISRRTLRLRNRAPEFQGGDSACTWKGLVDELRRLLDKTKPGVVVCPHPIIDAHPDHVFTTVALEQALHDSPYRGVLVFLYVVHQRDAPVYPFGPASSVVSLPPWTRREWMAESIYSHPLTPDVRIAKYFAIEATHDERAYANGEPRTVGQVFSIVKREVSALLGGVGLRPTSFLRRAPRPNEIFYVVSAESLTELVKRALAQYPSPQD